MNYWDIERANTLRMQRGAIKTAIHHLVNGDSDFMLRTMFGPKDSAIEGAPSYLGIYPVAALDIENQYILDMLESKLNAVDIELQDMGVTELPGNF